MLKSMKHLPRKMKKSPNTGSFLSVTIFGGDIISEANKIAVDIVEDYIISLDVLGVWQGYTLKQLSYSRYAALELLKRLKKDCEAPPLLIIERFRDKMDAYSRLNRRNDFIFTAARDVASGIVDELIS